MERKLESYYDHYELPQDAVNSSPQRKYTHESPRRQGYLMPLPSQSTDVLCESINQLEIGIPVDEIDERRRQEERDAVSKKYLNSFDFIFYLFYYSLCF